MYTAGIMSLNNEILTMLSTVNARGGKPEEIKYRTIKEKKTNNVEKIKIKMCNRYCHFLQTLLFSGDLGRYHHSLQAFSVHDSDAAV